MNQQTPNFEHIFKQLADEYLLHDQWQQEVRDILAKEHNEQPWYVRVMVGFSAWLAAWMLIGFVVGAAMVESEAATLVIGAMLVVGAAFARRVSDNDFMTQMALAASLAGEALVVFGIARLTESFEASLFCFMVMEISLVVFYPDTVHRFLSCFSVFGAWAGLFYKWELQWLLHVLVIGGAVGFIWLINREPYFLAEGKGSPIAPVKWGVLFGQLGILMLSTLYVLPQLVEHYEFFPYRWVSTLGLGIVLLYVVYQLETADALRLSPVARGTLYGVCVLLTAATLRAPGLIMALILVLLGFARADRLLTGVGIGFFVVFLTAFFYGIEVTLLTKSMLLTATGAILLASHWAVKHYFLPLQRAGKNG
ncbi:MAG: DUF4401 domain-containing protein [Gammaproteobacteria bacterium]